MWKEGRFGTKVGNCSRIFGHSMNSGSLYFVNDMPFEDSFYFAPPH